MDKLQVIKSANFGDIQCDFYGNGKDCYMTREQVGKALDYSDPNKAISNIHSRKAKRLDKYSVRCRNTIGRYFCR